MVPSQVVRPTTAQLMTETSPASCGSSPSNRPGCRVADGPRGRVPRDCPGPSGETPAMRWMRVRWWLFGVVVGAVVVGGLWAWGDVQRILSTVGIGTPY